MEKIDLSLFEQAHRSSYRTALTEIRNGRKQSHWMWYIFPQIDGLGFSPTARRYAVKGIDEARAYLAHSTLGPRLVAICEELLTLPDTDAEPIFGWPDVLKLRSSMTLFMQSRGALSASMSTASRRLFRSLCMGQIPPAGKCQ